jgi:Xaa-Pro aminopeptidase
MYLERRKKLLDFISQTHENFLVIIPANSEAIRNHDVHYKFRQDSNFFYFTGFEEPNSIAVLRRAQGKDSYVLFVREKDLSKEIWTGFRAGPEGAIKIYQADLAYTLDNFEVKLKELLKGVEAIYYSFKRTNNKNGVEFLDDKILRILNEHRLSLGRTGLGMLPIFDFSQVAGELRIYKSKEEIENIKKACNITARAHTEVMARTKPGLYEYQIEALLEYIFLNEGCLRHGYPSIVASGANATILHYVENNEMLKDGDLLLVDAGGEYNYYSADITRTFPINGKFTEKQAEIYKIVLEVQKECIKMVRPGQTLLSIHEFAVKELTKAMITLGFLDLSLESAIQSLAYKKYYPHNTGHLLGMDVHDAGLYYKNGEPRKLESGFCFTIEPGFYILENDLNVDEEYRGIGIRIEDDILVTEDGYEVLTKLAPKEMSDLTAIIGTKKWPSLN